MRRGEHATLRRALLRAGFRRLFAAQTISRWGDTFKSVALVILVYRTGSGVKVAGTVAFEIGVSLSTTASVVSSTYPDGGLRNPPCHAADARLPHVHGGRVCDWPMPRIGSRAK